MCQAEPVRRWALGTVAAGAGSRWRVLYAALAPMDLATVVDSAPVLRLLDRIRSRPDLHSGLVAVFVLQHALRTAIAARRRRILGCRAGVPARTERSTAVADGGLRRVHHRRGRQLRIRVGGDSAV